jgi:hypothetical protein
MVRRPFTYRFDQVNKESDANNLMCLYWTTDMSFPIAAAASGSCNHPGCTWTGLASSFRKHKEGAGRLEKRRMGMHEGCTCCGFVPDPSPIIEEPRSTLMATMAALGQQEHVPLHAHMQGEFFREAMIPDR